jgi:FkbM family methyltransferase
MNRQLAGLSQWMFDECFSLYRPLYSVYKRVSDWREYALIRKRVVAGMSVMDVGANIGLYTRYLSRLVGPTGNVVAFEPAPDNFAKLSRLCSKYRNVVLKQLALGDRTGTAFIYLSSTMNVDHRTYMAEDERRALPIEVMRLDDFMSAGQGLDFVKMDVQGAELQILRGARRVIEENPSLVILMEFWPFGLERAGTPPEELAGFLEQVGMKAVDAAGTTVNLLQMMGTRPFRPPDYCNVLLVR